MQDHFYKNLSEIISWYIDLIRAELEARWNAWALDMSQIEKHEVVGALLARQITLAAQLASAPVLWNGHVAPLILRAMVDNYINLAWIFNKDTLNRAKKFIEHGLGQQKLIIEHRKQEMKNRGAKNKDIENDSSIKMLEDWINSQRYTFFTTINVGQWAETDARKMAEEADCLDFYRYAYTPFSSNVHSMWNHVSRYNLKLCENPLRRLHKIPTDPDLPIDIDYLYRAAKYVQKALALFDEKTGVGVKTESSLKQLEKKLNKLNKANVVN